MFGWIGGAKCRPSIRTMRQDKTGKWSSNVERRGENSAQGALRGL
jgi:hypothetical protein